MNLTNPFTFKGRISRSHFAVSFLALLIIPPSLFFLLLFSIKHHLIGPKLWLHLLMIVNLVGSISSLLYFLSIVVRRGRDIGYSAGQVILRLMIPIVNIFLLYYLLFSPPNSRKRELKVGEGEYTSLRELERQAEKQNSAN